MTRTRFLLALAVAFLLLFLGLCAGVWWYLFGANKVQAAELVPADTVVFTTIPNGAAILAGYQTSQLKTLVDSPNVQALHDAVVNLVGSKNVDLLQTFLPNLSGQSFIAVTHFDYDKPAQIGLIAAMKPKAGLDNFDAFLEKLKATWPDVLKQGKTGAGTVAGVDYQWIQGPGASEKICVARFKGWIITSWGEAPLQDWIERFQKKSATPSLAQDPDYIQSLKRAGVDPMTLVYVNCHSLVQLSQKQMATANPAAGDYMAKKFGAMGGAVLATRFENGEIVDRFSLLMPRAALLETGMSADPCPFETLKFTGPDTRLYWASSIDWKQYYKNLQEQSSQSATVNPMAGYLLNFLQTWTQGAGLDVQHNLIDPLGSEWSVQAEWSRDSTYPEVGLFVKLDKPDDFKPTITAVIESVRKAYETSAVIKEINSNGQNFAALKFIQSAPFSPTITEDGPYLGVFLTENQAVRSFQRDESIELTHNADFNRQVGDKRNGAAQVLFLDSPYLLDRAYRIALPYLSIAQMFNKDLASMLKGRNLPPDLTWLAPMGTWSCVVTPDDAGFQGYSVSGVGNQGLFLGGTLGGSASLMQTMGFLPKPNVAVPAPLMPGNPAPPPGPLGPTTPAMVTPSTPADNGTNVNSGTNQVSPPIPAATNAPADTAPAAAPVTNTAPVTNSDLNATPPPPEPTPASPTH